MLSSRPMSPMSYLSMIFSESRIRALVIVGVPSLSICATLQWFLTVVRRSASESLDTQMISIEPFSGDGRFV